jgi:Asp-tRNA(Asn)/Glu-tRNA(Gln) amidotransferase A subunit family amidase
MTNQARRDISQKPDSIPPSEWGYHTIKELVEALQAPRISASELLEHTVARSEALDQRLNAVVVRDFDRAREAATAGRRRPRPRRDGGRCWASQ